MLEKYRNKPEYNDQINKHLGLLKKVLDKKHLINIFHLENEEDIEMSILTSLLNCKFMNYVSYS